jgi:hypothetical protein
MYANGIITRGYTPGKEITVTAHITANHVHQVESIKMIDCLIQGFMEFRLCHNDDVTSDPGQSCFEDPESALTVLPSGDKVRLAHIFI